MCVGRMRGTGWGGETFGRSSAELGPQGQAMDLPCVESDSVWLEQWDEEGEMRKS